MEYGVVIGLELHIELNTNSKLFSTSSVTYGLSPNTSTTYCDFAFPGTMPSLNKEAVVKAIQLCNALNMEIDRTLVFDRKNYYYSDLPKNYQITQETYPIGRMGILNINDPGEIPHYIKINRAHLEEDTCKQIHENSKTLIDYNRAGVPLIELVTEPVIKSGIEASKFVEKIRSIVTFLGISNGKMEEGSLRCDINISLKDKNSSILGTKVEIKNINSISNIKKAIDFEISRQSLILNNNGKIIQETRRFDDLNNETVAMRIKSDNIDYRCFIDPNIPPFTITDIFYESAMKSCRMLPDKIICNLLEMGLSISTCKFLTSNYDTYSYFNELIQYGCDCQISANWMSTTVQSYLNSNNMNIRNFKISSKNLSKMIIMIQEKFISHKFARDVFQMMLENDIDATTAVQLLTKDNHPQNLDLIINEVIKQNQKSIEDYKNGKDRALGYLVGQVLKQCSANTSPQEVKNILLKKMED